MVIRIVALQEVAKNKKAFSFSLPSPVPFLFSVSSTALRLSPLDESLEQARKRLIPNLTHSFPQCL